MTDQAAGARAPETLRFTQKADLGSFVGLSIVNTLLNIVTLTLYRFWAKTEVRRRVWRTTYLNDEPFEYTGKGVELFIGFLIALVVIGLPFLGAVFAVQMFGEGWFLLFLPLLYLFMFWLIGYGVFSALRYAFSRTTWRSVRFRLTGSGVNYGWSFVGNVLLIGITFGWWEPAAARHLTRPFLEGLRYGDKPFKFSTERAEKVGVYGPFALAWFGSLLIVILFYAGFFGLIAASGGFETDKGQFVPDFGFIAAIYGLMLVLFPLLVLVRAPYQAAILRSMAAGTGLDDARFKLDVRALPLAWLTISNLLILVFSLGFLSAVVQARTAKWIVNRLSAEGTADFSEVRQTARGPKSGEGIADAFDFAPI